MTLNEQQWNKIFNLVLKIVKHKLGLPTNFPTAALHHKGILGLNNPWFELVTAQYAELTRILNTQESLVKRTTTIRLRRAQLKT